MADTIEALLQENLGKVQELLAASEVLHDDVTSLQETGERIESEFDSVSNTTRENLKRLQSNMESFSGAIEKISSDLDERLEMLNADIEPMAFEIGDAASQLKIVADEIDQLLGNSLTEMQGYNQRVTMEFPEQIEHCNSLKESLAESVDVLRADSETFNYLIDEGINVLNEAKQTVSTAFDELQETGEKLFQEWVEGMEAGINAVRQGFDSSVEETENAASETIESITETFTQGASELVNDAFGNASNAFNTVKGTFDDLTGGALDSVQDVVEELDEVIGLVEEIKPVLKLVETLL